MRLRFGLIVTLLSGALAAAALAVTSSGSATTVVSGIQLDGDGYGLSTDAAGAATVIWTQQKPIDGVGGTGDVRVRQQNPAGGWGSTVQVGGVTQVDNAVLVESGAGAAVVAWTYVTGDESVIGAVTRASADGSWSAPMTVASRSDRKALYTGLTAVMNPSGLASVAWSAGTGGDPALSVATVNAISGTVSSPVQVAAAGSGGFSPSLAVNAAGAAVLSWLTQTTPQRAATSRTRIGYAELASYRTAGGTWGVPIRLGAYREAPEGAGGEVWSPTAPTSVVTANGTAAVSWRNAGPAADAPLDVSVRNPVRGSWSPAHTLSADVGGFALAPGPANSLVAVWSGTSARGFDEPLLNAVSQAGGVWSAPAAFARFHDGVEGAYLTAGADGAIALTPLTGGNGSAVEYTTRSTAGRWSALQSAGTGENSEIGFGPSGSLTLLWETFNAENQDTLHLRTVS